MENCVRFLAIELKIAYPKNSGKTRTTAPLDERFPSKVDIGQFISSCKSIKIFIKFCALDLKLNVSQNIDRH